jgi:hypothetical protein
MNAAWELPNYQTKTKSRTPQYPAGESDPLLRLKSLECFAEVRERLCKGWSVNVVARFVQEERGEATDLKVGTLALQMREYRRTEIPDIELAKHALPSVHAEATQRVTEGLDALSELEDLYRLQRKRLAIDVTTEENINKLFKSTVREVKEARVILQAYAQIQMDLGITKRHLGKLEVDSGAPQVVVSTESALRDVANNPKSRQKALTMVGQMMELAKRRSVEIEKDAKSTEAETEAA